MFTPQQLEQVSFSRATFGGYDMQTVDKFLEPLLEDYITLYKENALLKSKMKVLVSKLEEYRDNEASITEAIAETQSTCDKMVKETEEKCTQMLADAQLAAAENAKNADALILEENARVEKARQEAALQIGALQDAIRACLDSLETIKQEHRPETEPEASSTISFSSAVADEIAANLEALIGGTDETAANGSSMPEMSSPTGKFANLRFGPNYDPTAN